MKKKTVLLLWLLPLAIFIDYLLLVTFGCFSGYCKAGNSFFCSVYCIAGITLIVVSLVIGTWLLLKNRREKYQH
ncbi:MAG TPA: hypothetical protein P5531_10280 [Bacteroidales bacterium]|nr:hypothetical protein [Bacteroidales bacterium]HSA44026.1 hypothetical protein [Bacteroidales bacterium]